MLRDFDITYVVVGMHGVITRNYDAAIGSAFAQANAQERDGLGWTGTGRTTAVVECHNDEPSHVVYSAGANSGVALGRDGVMIHMPTYEQERFLALADELPTRSMSEVLA